ncbi:MAG: SPASM domain-containing protein, partial [Bryocella sp.]
QYGRFLNTIFDEWVRKDVGQQYVQIFEVSLEMWMGMEASLCVFRKQCGSALAMEHTGDVYSCDHFVYPENRLGNIMESSLRALVDSEQQQIFGEAKESTLPQYCLDCDVRFACNGECPKHRFLTTPDSEPGLNYLCAGYKSFFHHVDPYMRFMASELVSNRSPANVMSWVAEEDLRMAVKKAGRNDLCLCGSGKKFKHCCGRAA